MGIVALLENQLGHWPKFQKLHIYSLSTPGGWNWAYFCSTGSGFWDTGQFSKLPYLGMKFGHWPKFQKLHIYSLSIPGGRNWAYFHYGQPFPRYRPIFKIAIFGHETWPLAKVSEIAHILPILPPSPKLHSVLLCGWPFPIYWQFCIFPLGTMC